MEQKLITNDVETTKRFEWFNLEMPSINLQDIVTSSKSIGNYVAKYIVGIDIIDYHAENLDSIIDSEDGRLKKGLKLGLESAFLGTRQFMRYTPLVFEYFLTNNYIEGLLDPRYAMVTIQFRQADLLMTLAAEQIKRCKIQRELLNNLQDLCENLHKFSESVYRFAETMSEFYNQYQAGFGNAYRNVKRKVAPMKDPHLVLGVEEDSNEDEIKNAYRSLAKKYHPDLPQNRTRECKKQFIEVTEAYKTMLNQRKEHYI